MKPLSVMSKHDCAKHCHGWRPGPWGKVCAFCGVPVRILLAGLAQKQGLGRWVALGEHSRVWVPR